MSPEILLLSGPRTQKRKSTYFWILSIGLRSLIPPSPLLPRIQVFLLKAFLIRGKPLLTQSNPPTLRTLATNYLDICSVPRRSFFETLRHFSSDEQHVEKFAEFCTSEGQEELWDYTTRPRRTIVEVLADFWSSLKIPVEYVLDVIPAMKPRRFSIASSLTVFILLISLIQVHPNEIHLCVAIVKYKTNLKRPRWGVCSRWLAALQEGNGIFSNPKSNVRLDDPSGFGQGWNESS
jgi:sulfite reductase alpha subunit-like flavoprotein